MFSKILIANRGEIACRIIRTARRMGIATVAVYSDADERALHAAMADEAVRIGPPPAAESYLSVDAILAAAQETGAEAIHPGFGFLAENAGFAERVAEAGLIFIGPDPAAIAAMGDKIESKRLAMKAGVNTIPGHLEVIRNAEEAVTIAAGIGFPVMIKASAGGGGKGMRIARSKDEAREGFLRATSEAKSSFGDDRVFIEKYVVEPRHIEIQVLADHHGNIVHLGERECSIQRRHQKVIEEAPSPFIDAKTRAVMGAQAIALAEAVGYRSAGTVEFIVDRDRNFYFLEMNTRLQVEHPVTEFVTGLDLVELMIRIAAGEKLPFRQKDVKLKGWSIEARIYAEDPYRNFMPSTGRLVRYRPPAESAHVRIDSGIAEGGEISMFYDPMIAKLVTAGKTREEALGRMREALDAFVIRGVSHNLPFLAALMAHPRFAEGRLSTGFVEEEYPGGFAGREPDDGARAVFVAVAGAIHAGDLARRADISGRITDRTPSRREEWIVRIGEEEIPVRLGGVPERWEVGFSFACVRRDLVVESDWKGIEPIFRGYVGKEQVCIQVDRIGIGWRLSCSGMQVDAQIMTPRTAELARLMPEKRTADLSRQLLSPMPGLLIRVSVSEGDEIKAGEELAIVEAMKMENVLRADRDGVIKKIHAGVGASLVVDQVILEFE